jgi:hypothetical protein
MPGPHIVSTFRTSKSQPDWVPSLPRSHAVLSQPVRSLRPPLAPSARGRPYRPGVHPISRSCLLRGVIKGFTRVHPPGLPLACNPRMERELPGLDPWASHPGRQDLRRTPGRGAGIEHSPGTARPALPDLQSMRSPAMRYLVSHDRTARSPSRAVQDAAEFLGARFSQSRPPSQGRASRVADAIGVRRPWTNPWARHPLGRDRQL